MQGFLTTQEVAEKLGVTAGRVRQMIIDGQLPAIKVGRDNLIKESDLKLVQDRKVGRPPKTKTVSDQKQPGSRTTKYGRRK
ncbi:hypothetical protein BH20ACI3_BH20ACI3_27910 [soil metagenome]